MSDLIEITDPQSDRYASLKLIDWWDQRKLREARVMVVGAGALGNEALKNLALLGVGRLFIVDFDTVEAANLTRSVLFRAGDSGQRKVDVAAARVRELNPDVRVATFHGDVTKGVGLGVFRQVDVVLGCLDNRAARLAVNRACWRLGIPWIDGAIEVLMGMVKIFVPPSGACYECSMTPEDYALLNVRYSCPAVREEDMLAGRLLTTPTSASIVAAWQVQEAVRLLHGLDVPGGSGIYFNGQKYSTELLTLAEREDCYSHSLSRPAIIELPDCVADLTVGGLLEKIAAQTGPEATPSALRLEQEVVRRFYCPNCERDELVYRPYDEVMPYQVLCPTPGCKTNRLPSVISRIAAGRDGMGGAGDGMSVPLAQLGIPPLHIVQVEARDRVHFVELSGDRASVFTGWES